LLRRLRGVLITALIWGAGWSLVGLALGAVTVFGFRVFGLALPGPWSFLLDLMLGFGLMGVGGGSVFAVALSVAERRSGSLAALSMSRTGAWGALGGVAVWGSLYLMGHGAPMIFGAQLALVGAALAQGSLALARRGPRPSQHQVGEEERQ
jgi:hypothetical protein